MMLRSVRILVWGLIALILVWVGYMVLRPPAPAPVQRSTGVAEIGGPFTMVGTDGKPFSSQKLSGRPHAIFFGFTHCPDVCPTTLARMAKLRRQLGEGDGAFDLVFVSVDPERDTPAEMARYAGLFGTPVIALTGSQAQVDRMKKQYAVFSEKVPDGKGGYGVDHTSTVLLFDGHGDFIGTIAPEEGDEAALGKLRRLTS